MIFPSYSCISNAIHTSIYSMELLSISLLLEWKEHDSQTSSPGAKIETNGRWRQPTTVTLDVVSARNFNRALFLTSFFSRETLLLITVSLFCNEVQAFKDGLELFAVN